MTKPRTVWGVSISTPVLAPSCVTEGDELWAAWSGKVLVSYSKRWMLVIAGSAVGGRPQIQEYTGAKETINIMDTDWKQIIDQVR